MTLCNSRTDSHQQSAAHWIVARKCPEEWTGTKRWRASSWRRLTRWASKWSKCPEWKWTNQLSFLTFPCFKRDISSARIKWMNHSQNCQSLILLCTSSTYIGLHLSRMFLSCFSYLSGMSPSPTGELGFLRIMTKQLGCRSILFPISRLWFHGWFNSDSCK